jgi:hypothetical protein
MSYLSQLQSIVASKRFDDASKAQVESIISSGKVTLCLTKKDLMSKNVYNPVAASQMNQADLQHASILFFK